MMCMQSNMYWDAVPDTGTLYTQYTHNLQAQDVVHRMHWHHILCMQRTDNIHSKLNWLVWICGHWAMFVSSVHTVWLRSTEYLLPYHMMCGLVHNEEAGTVTSTDAWVHMLKAPPWDPSRPFLTYIMIILEFSSCGMCSVTSQRDVTSELIGSASIVCSSQRDVT